MLCLRRPFASSLLSCVQDRGFKLRMRAEGLAVACGMRQLASNLAIP
jgi:hypothetical protein